MKSFNEVGFFETFFGYPVSHEFYEYVWIKMKSGVVKRNQVLNMASKKIVNIEDVEIDIEEFNKIKEGDIFFAVDPSVDDIMLCRFIKIPVRKYEEGDVYSQFHNKVYNIKDIKYVGCR